VEHIISSHADLIGITRLFLNFLTTSDKLSDSDIEELARMVIFIRQARLGIAHDEYKFIDGNYIYECKLPTSFFMPYLKYPIDIHDVRKKLATILVPLVQNKFMPKWEWDMKELQKINSELTDLWCEILKLTKPV